MIIENVENHAYWQKLFGLNCRVPRSPDTISMSGGHHAPSCWAGWVGDFAPLDDGGGAGHLRVFS